MSNLEPKEKIGVCLMLAGLIAMAAGVIIGGVSGNGLDSVGGAIAVSGLSLFLGGIVLL